MIACAKCGVPIPEKTCPVCGHCHGPFADGGILELGIERDVTFAGRNDFVLFTEEFIRLADLTPAQVDEELT